MSENVSDGTKKTQKPTQPDRELWSMYDPGLGFWVIMFALALVYNSAKRLKRLFLGGGR